MQTAQLELKSGGLVAELAGTVGLQFSSLFSKMAQAARVRQERRQLLDMPEYLLKDIGITRAQAYEEAQRLDLPEARC